MMYLYKNIYVYKISEMFPQYNLNENYPNRKVCAWWPRWAVAYLPKSCLHVWLAETTVGATLPKNI